MIELRLFATLRNGREKKYFLDADKFRSGLDLCDYFNIPHETIANFLINGFHHKLKDSIRDGDVVSLFPPCAGG